MIEKPIFCIPLDLGTIATGNERAEAPASHLGLFKAPGLVWRSNGNGSLYVRGQLATAQAISMCSMLQANAQAGTKIRLRLGTSQAQVDGTAPYDSGNVDFISPAMTRESNRYHAFLSFAEVSASWWRIDITGHTGDFEAMAVILGKGVQTTRFYDRGWELSAPDLGSIDLSPWGVPIEGEGITLNAIGFALSWVSEAEFEANFRKILKQGKRQPTFILFDPQAAAARQEKFYFGRFGQPPFARNSRKPQTFAMEFAMQSMI